MHDVSFYFDFLSPYSGLALLQAERFAEEHDVRWRMRPVLLAALLDANDLPGGAEIPAKRAYISADVLRCAEVLGVPFKGPPEHPFLPLDALRAVCLYQKDPSVEQASIVRLCVELARACWCEGRPLTELTVLQEVIEAVGLDATDLPSRILARPLKKKLKEYTAEALERGVFGVPTFVIGADEPGPELFWGQDRLTQLAARLSGSLSSPADGASEILARPAGFDRRRLRNG